MPELQLQSNGRSSSLPTVNQEEAEMEEALKNCVAQLESMYADKENGPPDLGTLTEMVSSLEAQVRVLLEERNEIAAEVEVGDARTHHLRDQAQALLRTLTRMALEVVA